MKNLLVDIFYYFSFIASFAIGIFYFLLYKGEMVGFWIFIAAGPLLLALPVLVFKMKTFYENYNGNLKNTFKVLACIMFYSNALGALYFYKQQFFEYDQFAHFFTFLSLAILSTILYRVAAVNVFKKEEPKLSFALPMIFFVMLISGLLFEFLQYSLDTLFASHLFFDSNQPIQTDVLTDVRSNTLGTLTGLLVLKIQWKKLKDFIKTKAI